MTYLEAVNNVLRRLRENEVSSVNETSYSKLIGNLVNDTKKEVENAWEWNRLRSTIIVTTVPGTYRYVLTGAGDRSRITHVINDTQNVEMQYMPGRQMDNLFLMATVQTGNPFYYNVNGVSGDDPAVDIWPVPNAADSLNFIMVIPQADLSADSDVITVNSYPIVLGAWAKAISERGEDGSTQYAEVVNSYANALADSIALDSNYMRDELIWEVC